MAEDDVLVRLRDVTKDYRGLRPLRVRELALRRGRSLALLGFDQAMAEVLVNLLTGGVLPDSGEVSVFGEQTSAIRDRDRWIGMLDRFGLVSDRSVLLESLTAEQNLAIPLSLSVERMSDGLRRDVRQLADEVGIRADELGEAVATLRPEVKLRIRLGRALALEPEVLLAEHPTATLDQLRAREFAADFLRIATARGAATLVLTADHIFARRVAEEVLVLQPATGELKAPGRWPWLRNRFLSC
jgi:ABC-type transporter Mla maintaining outer membrane lipid asymmetry ATPase subunit MlaF